MDMNRRDFLLSSTAFLSGAFLPGMHAMAQSGQTIAGKTAIYLVPGYRIDVAAYRGVVVESVEAFRRGFPPEYDGADTLVTRIDERSGTVKRAMMPLVGHAISINPAGNLAFWNSIDGTSMVSFDPDSLELGVFAKPHGQDRRGGGHAVFMPDGNTIIVAERMRYRAGPKPQDMFGQITIRDARTLKVLEAYSSHGVSPHDIALLDDGKHIALAHYGTMGGLDAQKRPLIMQPSLCVLELASGKLVHKWVGPHPRREVRHLAAGGLDRIAAIQIDRGTAQDLEGMRPMGEGIYEPDITVQALDEYVYLPTPVGFYGAGRSPLEAALADPMATRQGQTILYDPRYDEFIATFASSHTVIVFDGESGKVRRLVRSDKIGLRYPRGLALHPDGIHYVVSGHWRGIHLFRRGTHEPVFDRTNHTVLFGHSHIAVMAA